MYRRSLLVLLVAVVALTGACGTDDDASTDPLSSTTTALRPSTAPLPSSTSSVPSSTDAQRFPDVIAVEVDRAPDGTARFDVTISSPYDSPDRYADAWRVLGPDGVDYGVRELAHDHANEQPFTRSLDGVVIPDEVTVVTVEARDSTHGWGGATVDVEL